MPTVLGKHIISSQADSSGNTIHETVSSMCFVQADCLTDKCHCAQMTCIVVTRDPCTACAKKQSWNHCVLCTVSHWTSMLLASRCEEDMVCLRYLLRMGAAAQLESACLVSVFCLFFVCFLMVLLKNRRNTDKKQTKNRQYMFMHRVCPT